MCLGVFKGSGAGASENVGESGNRIQGRGFRVWQIMVWASGLRVCRVACSLSRTPEYFYTRFRGLVGCCVKLNRLSPAQRPT